jgi:DNA-binding transcriptional MocR family regulator
VAKNPLDGTFGWQARAVVEDPTFPGVLDALQRAGARPAGVPPGDVSRLSGVLAAHRSALAYLISTYQNPTGRVMTVPEREHVAALARRYPDVIVIDDVALADLPLTDDSREPAADLGSAAYHQGIVAALVSGFHDEIVKWRAEWLRPRYDALASALRSQLPDWTWVPPRGGLTIWARLPDGTDSGAFAQEALRRGVALVPGRLLSVSDQTSSFARLAFVLSSERLAAATAALAAHKP